jgi:hypothetical protein
MAEEQGPKPPAGMPTDTETTRRAHRVTVQFTTEYTGKRVDGTGTVRNISQTGALIEPAEPPLTPGSHLRVRFSFLDSSLGVELGSEIVRKTPSGFAVRFTEMDERSRNILTLVIARAVARDLMGDDDERTLANVPEGGSGD